MPVILNNMGFPQTYAQLAYISQYYENTKCNLRDIEIYNLMKASSKIIMATDGGAIKHKGSLGFILTNTDGTILLSCYGRPAGYNPMSFRSEACAFLAAIRIIY